jgi:hypothetical protein
MAGTFAQNPEKGRLESAPAVQPIRLAYPDVAGPLLAMGLKQDVNPGDATHVQDIDLPE